LALQGLRLGLSQYEVGCADLGTVVAARPQSDRAESRGARAWQALHRYQESSPQNACSLVVHHGEIGFPGSLCQRCLRFRLSPACCRGSFSPLGGRIYWHRIALALSAPGTSLLTSQDCRALWSRAGPSDAVLPLPTLSHSRLPDIPSPPQSPQWARAQGCVGQLLCCMLCSSIRWWTMVARTATCACGQLRIICASDPVKISLCHCLDCQKRTAAPMA
jgi:hypothetical protein